MPSSRLIAWFGACLVLAVVSRWQTFHARADRCSLDGSRITKAYQVDLVAGGDVVHRFCCVRCATEWPDVPADRVWHVRDEMTGETLDATVACFVRSGVVTVAARRDHVHVFRKWPDALQHVEEHGGERIANPFAKQPKDK